VLLRLTQVRLKPSLHSALRLLLQADTDIALPQQAGQTSNDDLILRACLALQSTSPNVVLVTNDVMLQTKAIGNGLEMLTGKDLDKKCPAVMIAIGSMSRLENTWEPEGKSARGLDPDRKSGGGLGRIWLFYYLL
jgi:predicted RNA-binding protein with PIN domain